MKASYVEIYWAFTLSLAARWRLTNRPQVLLVILISTL
jgi:hypothetical protein